MPSKPDAAVDRAIKEAGLQALREAHELLDELGAPTVSNDPDPDEFGTIAFLEERIKMAIAAAREQAAGEQDARIANLIARLEPGDLPHLVTGKAMSAALQGFADRIIREAREEGCIEGRLSGKRAMQELMRSHSELQKQLAAKEADCAAMRCALLPFVEAERAWMAGGPQQRIAMDDLTRAREAYERAKGGGNG